MLSQSYIITMKDNSLCFQIFPQGVSKEKTSPLKPEENTFLILK